MLLSNKLLIEAYQKAYELNLDKDFIDLLSLELQRRKIILIPKI